MMTECFKAPFRELNSLYNNIMTSTILILGYILKLYTQKVITLLPYNNTSTNILTFLTSK